MALRPRLRVLGKLMAKSVSPVLVNLIYDALLKCFWYKESLKRYLRSSGISETAVSHMDPADGKRVWLDGLFPKLIDHANGADILMAMARSLAGMTTFPDLDRHEDSAKKIVAAREAVATLGEAIGAESDKAAEARDIEEKRRRGSASRQAAARHQTDLSGLKAEMEGLLPLLGSQAGGYAFEK